MRRPDYKISGNLFIYKAEILPVLDDSNTNVYKEDNHV
jgi:hypothetical protein